MRYPTFGAAAPPHPPAPLIYSLGPDEDALYFQLCRDCYEALVIASFFNLLVSYISSPKPTLEVPIPPPYKTRVEREAALSDTVRDLHLDKWMFPFGSVKWRAAGGGEGEGRVSRFRFLRVSKGTADKKGPGILVVHEDRDRTIRHHSPSVNFHFGHQSSHGRLLPRVVQPQVLARLHVSALARQILER